MISNKTFNIDGKLIKLNEEEIVIDNLPIRFSDVVNFDFVSQYLNLNGSTKLTLITQNETIQFNQYDNINPFRKTHTANALTELFKSIYPKILPSFLISSVQQLKSGETLNIAKINFNKYGIEFNQKKLFSNKVYKITYADAAIAYQYHRLGFFGGKGYANFVHVFDYSSTKEYTLSNFANKQPSLVECYKAEALIEYIKQTQIL